MSEKYKTKLVQIIDDEEGLDMNKKQLITATQAWGVLIAQGKTAIFYVPVMMILLTMAWKTYGEPKIREITTEQLAPIEKEVQNNQYNVADIKFSMAQILLIMQKTTDQRIIDEVTRETEIFKPTR